MSVQHFIRKEKAGSIFYRVTGLLRSGQMKWKERPLWYDVYASNPPQYEPTAIAAFAKQDEPVRQLFYAEDIIRAKFYKQFRSVGAISVVNDQTESLCQIFIDVYVKIAKMWPDLSEEEIYQKALVALNEKLSEQQYVGDRIEDVTSNKTG